MNKYLEKVASLESAAESIRGFGRDFRKGWKESSTTSKVGLGMSATSIGLGTANFRNGRANRKNNEARGKLEEQSLQELKGISDSLKKKQHVTVHLKTDHEKTADDKKKSNWHPGTAIGATIAGSVLSSGLAIPQLHLTKKVIDKVHSPSDSGADLGTIKKFMRDNGLHKTTTFNTRSHATEKNFGTHSGSKGKLNKAFKAMADSGGMGSGPAYLHAKPFGAKKNVIIGKEFNNNGSKKINPDVLMHELGHAKDYASHGGLKMALRGATRLAPLASLGALSNDKTRDYAPAIAAVPGIAMLRDEAAANYHAYHGIKAHKGTEAANKFVKKLLPSQMGSYALAAAAPVAGTYIAKKIMDKIHPKEQKN